MTAAKKISICKTFVFSHNAKVIRKQESRVNNIVKTRCSSVYFFNAFDILKRYKADFCSQVGLRDEENIIGFRIFSNWNGFQTQISEKRFDTQRVEKLNKLFLRQYG